VELKLHVEVMPVSDVDRAKDFHKLGAVRVGQTREAERNRMQCKL